MGLVNILLGPQVAAFYPSVFRRYRDYREKEREIEKKKIQENIPCSSCSQCNPVLLIQEHLNKVKRLFLNIPIRAPFALFVLMSLFCKEIKVL